MYLFFFLFLRLMFNRLVSRPIATKPADEAAARKSARVSPSGWWTTTAAKAPLQEEQLEASSEVSTGGGGTSHKVCFHTYCGIILHNTG